MKRSGFLARQQAKQDAEALVNHRFTRQLMCDVAMIALNDAFGFGPERLHKFADKLVEVFAVYAERWNSDTKDTEYTRAKLDEKLKQICGPYFVPWEERYR